MAVKIRQIHLGDRKMADPDWIVYEITAECPDGKQLKPKRVSISADSIAANPAKITETLSEERRKAEDRVRKYHAACQAAAAAIEAGEVEL